MAERRMFAKTIIDSDAFLDMPVTARLLYYDLAMRADDDGFVNSPKKIMRMIGASQDDLTILGLRKFIIPFETGIVVIKHWKIHNYIRKDTYNETKYKEEKSELELDENNAYRLLSVDGPSTQVRLGKDRLGQERSGECIEPPAAAPAPHTPIVPDPEEPVRHKHGANGWVRLTDEQYTRLLKEFGPAELERCITYVDESAQITKNKNGWKDWNLVIRKCHREKWGMKPQKQAAAPQRKKSFSELAAEMGGGTG